jgi:steroid delta-isomerase-like uncharacterized protein
MVRNICFFLLFAAAASLPATALADSTADKATAARVFLEKMGQGRFEIAAEVYGPGFVAHGFGRDYTLAEDDASGRTMREAFPDLTVTIERSIAEGDLVAVHWRGEGTNTVANQAFPGNGAKVAIDGMTFFRFVDGRIVEEWSVYDNLSIMKQLEAGPTP